MARRLLTISHSYVVGQNRRLAHEMAKAGAGRWEVVAAAPRVFRGDLRNISLEQMPEEANGLVTLNAHGTRWPHLFWYDFELRGLLRQNWDLIHGWEEPFVLAGAQMAALSPKRTPLVLVSAQNLSKRYPPPFSSFERFAVRRSTGLVTIGQTAEKTLAALPGYRRKPIRALPLGVDVELFSPQPLWREETLRHLGWSKGPGVVGCLGRFVPEKGARLLMRALEGVSAPWRALWVGGGPLESELRAWAQRHPDRVRVVTGVKHDEVPRYLNAMDVLCAPSQTTPKWREQFGRMLVEALACGTCVIGSDSGEIPFTVGDAGCILPESEVAAWSQTIDRLLVHSPERAELREKGLARARECFAWPVVARRHLEFFDQLLQGRA